MEELTFGESSILDIIKTINSTEKLSVKLIGQIDMSSGDIETNTQVLSDFVTTQLGRQPKKGDMIETNDNQYYLYNNSSWANFISVKLATVNSSGSVKLGEANGELQDKGEGKVGVIGWDSVLLNNNDQNLNGSLIFGNNRDKPVRFRRNGSCYVNWENSAGNTTRAYMGFSSSSNNNFSFNLNYSDAIFFFNKLVRYSTAMTPTNDNDLVSKKYVDDNTPSLATNETSGLIKLGDGTVQGELTDKGEGVVGVVGWDNLPKLNGANLFTNDNCILNDKVLKLGYNASDIKLTLSSVSGLKDALIEANQGVLRLKSKQGVRISLEGSQVDCNNTRITNVSAPTDGGDAVNKSYVDSRITVIDSNTEPSTVLTENGMIGFQRIS